MMRVMGMVAAATVVSQLAAHNALAVPTTEQPHPAAPHSMPVGNSAEPTDTKVSSLTARPHYLRHRLAVATHREPRAGRDTEFATAPREDLSVTTAETTADPALSALPPNALTVQEQDVGRIAVEHGDQKFLMVDKSLGRILLWENGKPVFAGNALTGASYSDRLPSSDMKEAFAKLNALDTKVTPAGRFTVARGFEKGYGSLFEIQEVRGTDWAIAIHKVFLGFPWENRAARLQSTRYDDKNITFGCINVTPESMQVLLKELPETGATPLYVLPRDETRTAAFFTPPSS